MAKTSIDKDISQMASAQCTQFILISQENGARCLAALQSNTPDTTRISPKRGKTETHIAASKEE